MLNDILDLCIEKSSRKYFYEFKYSGLTRVLTISKWRNFGGNTRVWTCYYYENELEVALKSMENE